MARKVLLINVILFAVVGVLAYRLMVAWDAFNSTRNLERTLAEVADGPGAGVGDPLDVRISDPVIPDYYVIAEKDLFRPERRPPDVAAEEQAVVEAPKFPQTPQMQGVTEAGGETRALLTIFDSPRAPGESRMVKLGDLVQGYSVAEITPTTVTLRWNDVEQIIDMFDSESAPQQQAQNGGRGGSSVNIIRIGNAAAAVESSAPEGSEAEQRVMPTAGSRGIVTSSSSSRRGLPSRRGGGGAGAVSAAPAPSGVVGVPGRVVPAGPPSTPEQPQ